MAILKVLTDKFYGISGKTQKLNQLYQRYMKERAKIEKHGEAFNQDLDHLKAMIVYNSALLIIASQVRMSDEDYGQWLLDHKIYTVGNPEVSEVAEVFAFVSDLTGGVAVGKVVKNLALALKNKIFSSAAKQAGEELGEAGTEEISEILEIMETEGLESGVTIEGEEAAETLVDTVAEDITEETVESATTGSLGAAAIGGAIVITLAVDGIISAIESANEAHQIEDQTKKLEGALNKVSVYLKALDTKWDSVKNSQVTAQEKFLASMKLLDKIQTADFDWGYKPGLENTPKILAAMHAASAQYGYLQNIKESWQRMKENMSGLTWQMFTEFKKAEAPDNLTEKQLDGLFAYASQYSQSMQSAQKNS
ncbi:MULTISPECIES: hypothetical protein [unclassified Moorena]|uniref:hypothetical protein n=1 Tax=unclassified Moorena TaxID=2683338 RepID=UPI00140098CA|nr:MULTISPECIES: hypothetical protein [unclassified Moorena]NEO15397.1 hypothetical protein [Moorena sp. SIO3E8]NEQ01101.1 hypothetical protein [Moorena sp. SIO3F7]